MGIRETIAQMFLGENQKIVNTFDSIKSKEDQNDKYESMGYNEYEIFTASSYYDSIYRTATEKRKLVQDYRSMAMFPEVADAIDEICDEAIVPNEEGEIVSLQITDEKLSKNKNVVANLNKEFDHVINKVLDFNQNGFTFFRKYYIEGELYIEQVIDPAKRKEGIQKINVLPPETMITEQDQFGGVEKFIQKIIPESNSNIGATIANTSDNEIEFSTEQISYVNSGIYSPNKNIYLSFIERAKVAYRQLKWLEDALIIHRIVRAPEKLVFNIDVGNMTKSKSDEYMKKIIQKYKQKKVYNPATGEVDIGKNVIAMDENYWLPKRADGTGTDITSVGGNTNFSDHIDDVMLFVKKLYMALKVPQKRFQDEGSQFIPSGKEGEIDREEIKFSKYVTRVRIRFSDIVYQVFSRHLKLKGLWKQYKLDKDKISILFNVENEWRESKKLANWERRLELFTMMAEYSPGEESQIFSNDFLKKNILKMTDEEINEMNKQIEKEKEELEKLKEPEDGEEPEGDSEKGGEEPKAEPDKEEEPPEEESEILQS